MSEPVSAIREAALARTFVSLADTLVSEFDVTDLFHILAGACVDVLGAATAGLMLADPAGILQLVASTSEVMHELEEFEVTTGEGPCLDCYAAGRPVAVVLSDADSRERWPRFTQRALAADMTSVQALPMRLRGDTIGALNIFHSGTGSLGRDDTEVAQALADVATIAILQRRMLNDSEHLVEQLQVALNDRIVIEQVKGLLAERGQLSIDEAFTLLRDFCRSSRLPLTRTARELVSRERDPDDVLAHRWPATPSE
jgi:GAF domain-containing protein